MSLACGGRAAAHDTHTRARRDRERRIHSGAAAAPVYIGEAWFEHVAQLDEEDARLVTAQLRQRHRGARGEV